MIHIFINLLSTDFPREGAVVGQLASQVILTKDQLKKIKTTLQILYNDHVDAMILLNNNGF